MEKNTHALRSRLIAGIVLGGMLVLGAILFFAYHGERSLIQAQRHILDNAAPEHLSNVTLKDFSGRSVSLQDFRGKYLVLNAWASWCPFCEKELPDFAATQKNHRDSIVFIAINRGESLATARAFTDREGVTGDMLFLLDPTDSFYASIGGFTMPETLFVDREGIIRAHKRGPLTREELEEKIKTLIR